MTMRQRRAVAATLIVSGLVLAACGGSDSAGSEDGDVATEATEPTVPAPSTSTTVAPETTANLGGATNLTSAEGEDMYFAWTLDGYEVVEDPATQIGQECPSPSLPEPGTSYIAFSFTLDETGRENRYRWYIEIGILSQDSYLPYLGFNQVASDIDRGGITVDVSRQCTPLEFGASLTDNHNLYGGAGNPFQAWDRVDFRQVALQVAPNHTTDGVVVARIFHQYSEAYGLAPPPGKYPFDATDFGAYPWAGPEIATIPMFALDDPLAAVPTTDVEPADVDARLTSTPTFGACSILRYSDGLFESIDSFLVSLYSTERGDAEWYGDSLGIGFLDYVAGGALPSVELADALDGLFSAEGEEPNPDLYEAIFDVLATQRYLPTTFSSASIWSDYVDGGCPSADSTPTSPEPPPAGSEGVVDCDGSWLTVVASAPLVNVESELDRNPGGRILRADESCLSLNPTFNAGAYVGQPIYIVFYGPFATSFTAQEQCLNLGKVAMNDCYVAPLTNDPADRSVRLGPTD